MVGKQKQYREHEQQLDTEANGMVFASNGQ
jgi:hypothetical protein